MTDELHDDTLSPTPRPQRRWLGNLVWLLSGAVLTLLLIAGPLHVAALDAWLHFPAGHHAPGPATEPAAATKPKQLWTCGMHPQVIEDHPGKCPICGMDLVPLDAGTEGAGTVSTGSAPASERKLLFYRNPMDPTITSPVPAKDSMGMDYVPVYADEVEASARQGAPVRIDPAVVQNMNVVTAEVERGDLTREIRTVGFLDYDQQKMVSVTTRVPGFVEKVYVNYIGEPVRKGQPLFEIYSPELVQTQEELLSALAYAGRLGQAPPEARQRAQELVEAARRRLGYWDIGAAQIADIESSGAPRRTLTVTAPAGGVVMMRMNGLEGTAVKPGMELFHIADLSNLWLSVEVFEDQLPWLRIGSEADITLSYFPGEVFRGKVRFVEPEVDEKTRTVGLRLEVPNRDGRLRAGMYATVRFAPVVAHGVVTVPSLAILRTGERNLVVVALGEGRFAPRDVELGAEGERRVEVRSGLEPGERIVTSAQFLIDSESNLREAIQKLVAAKLPAATGEKPATPGADH
jgi:RND family efflux transporter MFP subunit